MLIRLLVIALGVWFLLWPESARRTAVLLHRPFGRNLDPPSPEFVQLVGLTWLLLLAWFW